MDEPSIALGVKRFLSRIPDRRPVEKLHAQVNHARSAVTNYFGGYTGYGTTELVHRGSQMEIYEMVDDRWVLLHRIMPGDVEVPWKKGTLVANQQAKRAKEALESQKLHAYLRIKATQAWYDSDEEGDEPRTGHFEFLDGYAQGFLAAKAEYERK